VVDLGYRGVDEDNPGIEIIHRGKYKTMTDQQKRWLKRRQAIEPTIGHAKSDNRMDRCWLQGALGDALHALSCAAGYNIRWLLRAIVRLGLKVVFLRLFLTAMAGLEKVKSTYAQRAAAWMRSVAARLIWSAPASAIAFA
jgi:IS5 family transposase